MADEKHSVVSFLGDIFGHQVGDAITGAAKNLLTNATTRHEAIANAKRETRPWIVANARKLGLTRIVRQMGRPIYGIENGRRVLLLSSRDVEETVCLSIDLVREDECKKKTDAVTFKDGAEAIVKALKEKKVPQNVIDKAVKAAEAAAKAVENIQEEVNSIYLLVLLDEFAANEDVWRENLVLLDDDTAGKRATRFVRNAFSEEGCGDLADALDDLFR